MSGTGSLMIRNLRNPSDYSKGVMTQDELLRIAIANDANVAGARKNFQAGLAEEISPQQSKSPYELQADIALQEKTALDNLLKLFAYREAGEIIGVLNPDELFILNQSFPQIQKDISSKFNSKLVSPTFFVEYLRKFIEELNASKGVSTNLSTITNQFNLLTDNINDIRAILPTQEQFGRFRNFLARTLVNLPRQIVEPVIERVDRLQSAVPSSADFARMGNESEGLQYETLSMLQNLTTTMPTQHQLQMIIEDINGGRVSQQEGFQRLQNAISGVTDAQLEGLDDLRRDIAESMSSGSREGLDIIAQITTPVPSFNSIAVAKRVSGGTPSGKELIFKLLGNGASEEVTGRVLEAMWRGSEPFRSWWATNVRTGVTQSKPAVTDLRDFIKRTAGSVSSSASVATTAETGKTGFGLKAKNGRIKTIKIGEGVAYEPEPNYRQFGKYVINIPQLKERDILNVKFPSLGRIPQFKPTPISDVFKEFLLDLLETGKISNRIYEQIPVEERQLFERIATGAGIIHSLKIKKTLTDDDKADNERFAVLKGEYLAGNNSVALMKELRKLVVKFMSQGKISKTDGMNLLIELSV
jgi:hypothetical protein